MTDPPDIHPDFYPATSEVRWEPLQAVLPAERIGEFMFMMADPGLGASTTSTATLAATWSSTMRGSSSIPST